MLADGFQVDGDNIVCQHDDSIMAYVPAGVFIMGTELLFNARPLRHTTLDAYLIDRYPVTNAQYAKFVAAGGYQHQEYWSKQGWAFLQQEQWQQPRYWFNPPWNHATHPVVGISWFEAEAYAQWAHKALPTEAQWEKAARGGIWLDGDQTATQKNPYPQRKYAWGDHEPFHEGIWYAICKEEPEYGSKSTAPVGTMPQGASPYGCYDMTGNVWEWCRDRYQRDYYKKGPDVNPPGPSEGTSRILRGGSWCRESRQLYVSFRTKDEPENGGWDLSGFRCVKEL